MDKEAQEWIEAIIAEKFPAGQSYEDVLKDGQVLCKLINVLSPNAVPKVNSSGGQFKFMENINNFQKALKEYGVLDIDVFQTVDLYEKKDIANVTNTIFALGRAVSFKSPSIPLSARLILELRLIADLQACRLQGSLPGPQARR